MTPRSLAWVPLALALSTPAFAASDYLLQLDEPRGKPSSIEIQSFSWGVSNPGAGPGRVTIASRDAGSGMATGKRCAVGREYPSATLTRPGETWRLTGVIVASCPATGLVLSYRTVVKSKSNITNN
jgi:hypothetical protein